MELRCAKCNSLACGAVKLRCCGQSVCGACVPRLHSQYCVVWRYRSHATGKARPDQALRAAVARHLQLAQRSPVQNAFGAPKAIATTPLPPKLPDGYSLAITRPSSTVCVPNLPRSITTDDLTKMLLLVGRIMRVDVRGDDDCTCTGFAEVSDQQEAAIAVAHFTGYQYLGRVLQAWHVLCPVQATSAVSKQPTYTWAPAMQVTGSSSVTTSRTHGMLDLPQELLDCIFDLAYPREGHTTWLDRGDWDANEREKQRTNRKTHTARAFPRPKVDDFVVCKRFFTHGHA